MKLIIFFSLVFASISAKPSIHPYLKHGEDATPGQFPYQISYQFNYGTFYRHFCGGVILSNTWILTSAQCAHFNFNPEVDNFRVRAGIYKLSDNKTAQDSFIAEKVIHPKYDLKNGLSPNDIGLLKLATPLIFNDFVQPIKLPGTKTDIFGQGMVTGWGSKEGEWELDSPVDVLQIGNFAIMDISECANILGNLWPGTNRTAVLNSNICTESGTCAEDQGGPLVQDGVVVGIVSHTMFPCGMGGYPSVFTNVSSFIGFIKEHVDDLP